MMQNRLLTIIQITGTIGSKGTLNEDMRARSAHNLIVSSPFGLMILSSFCTDVAS